MTSASNTNAAEPDDPRRPGAIDTENVPVVPAEIFDKLRQFQNIRAASFGGWLSSGRGMVIHTRFGNSVQVHQVTEPGSRREQLTFADEPTHAHILPQAADGALLLTSSSGGSENEQIYLFDRANFRTVLLTDGKSRNLLGPISHDGKRIVVHSNQRNGRDVDIYVADPRTPNSMKLLFSRPGEYWSARDWSPDGAQLLVSRYVSINESYPGILDVSTGELTPIKLPTDEKAAVGVMAFGHDGESVFLATDAKAEFLNLYQFKNLRGSMSSQPLSADIPWDVTDVVVDRTSGRIAFAVNEGGSTAVYVKDPESKKDSNVSLGRVSISLGVTVTSASARRRLDLPLGVISGLEFSADGKQLGMTVGRADAPAEAYSVNLADGKLTRWTYSETGGLNPASFVKPEKIKFRSFDDREIPAYVYRPRSAGNNKSPVVIQIHGGPESQYRPEFSNLAQFLTSQLGVAYIAPNVRGSAGHGKSYLLLDNGDRREGPVKDIGALLDWIAAQKDLDPQRVAVMGGSYGGFMVLASLVAHGDRIRAGIDEVGIANFVTFLEQTSPYRQDLRRAEYGDERQPEMRQFLTRISPANNVDKIRSALLVIHGRNDPRVPFAEAEQIASKVRAAGRTVWTVYADNEGHGFGKKDNRDYSTAVQVLFLQKNLLTGGAEAETPASR